VSKKEINGVIIDCVQGDIANQPDMDVIVNAANAALRTGGGVAGAIHRAAGPGLESECRPLAPIKPGQAVITGAHKLPNRHVIHCLGPIYGKDNPSDQLLAECYRNAMRLANDNHLRSIGFPAISTGAFGYPIEAATQIAIDTVMEELRGMSSISHVRFILFGANDQEIYERILEKAIGI
jgi:O-acetyl-ADP-ribose deacetylase